MGAKVVIVLEGLDEVVNRLDEIGKKAGENLQMITKDFGSEIEREWQEVTPRGKTGRLIGGDKAEAQGLSITLENDVYYYKFVDEGHKTPRGWHTKHGYRPAKHVSQVEGRLMTERVTKFIEGSIEDRYSKFLDNV